MHVSGFLLLLVALLALSVVIIVRLLSKRNFIRDRKPLSLKEIYQQEFAGSRVSYEIFEKVLELIAQSYNIDSRLLRPSDKLKALYDFDSWELGRGTETLISRIEKELDLKQFEAKPKTIKELVMEIEKRLNRNPAG